MTKNFVLDTNVLIHDPGCIFNFEENHLFIPITVLEELDKKKSAPGEIGYSARQAIRLLDGLRGKGNLSKGVPLPENGRLKVVIEEKSVLHSASADNLIISVAARLKQAEDSKPEKQRRPVVLVSKDTAVRVKAESLGLDVQDYTTDKTEAYKEHGHIYPSFEALNGHIKSVSYVCEGDSLWRAWGGDKKVKVKRRDKVYGISPKNIEQEAALDALLTPELSVVALVGLAGSGKTLLSLAAGLYQYEKGRKPGAPISFDQILVSRPVVPIGKDLGYLPGEIEDKFRPWLMPILDNLDFLVKSPSERKDDKHVGYKSSQYILDNGIVQVQPLTYIRGRSLPRTLFIMDECQQLRPLDIKTLLTRSGEGSKIVLCGDLDQIDTPYLDAASSGLAYLVDRFINEEDFCYLRLKEGARSSLAERAAKLL